MVCEAMTLSVRLRRNPIFLSTSANLNERDWIPELDPVVHEIQLNVHEGLGIWRPVLEATLFDGLPP